MQYEARRCNGPPGYPPSRLCPLTSMHYMRYFCCNRMLLPSGEYRRNSETQFCGQHNVPWEIEKKLTSD